MLRTRRRGEIRDEKGKLTNKQREGGVRKRKLNNRRDAENEKERRRDEKRK